MWQWICKQRNGFKCVEFWLNWSRGWFFYRWAVSYFGKPWWKHSTFVEKCPGLILSINILFNLFKKVYLHSNMQHIHNFLIAIFFIRLLFLRLFRLAANLQFGLQNYAVAKDYKVRITKLRTCGCAFKHSEASLRTCGSWLKILNMQLRTCGCGLWKLKFVCGVADCWLKKKTCCAQLCSYCRQLQCTM